MTGTNFVLVKKSAALNYEKPISGQSSRLVSMFNDVIIALLSC